MKFISLGSGATCVDLEHRDFDRISTDGEAYRNGLDRGWPVALDHFTAECQRKISSLAKGGEFVEDDGLGADKGRYPLRTQSAIFGARHRHLSVVVSSIPFEVELISATPVASGLMNAEAARSALTAGRCLHPA